MHHTPESDRGRRLDFWLAAAIVLAGLLLRLPYLWEISQSPAFSYPIYDPEYNAYWARGLATGDWTVPAGVNDPEIRTTPHGRPPGYPWFLAGVYLVFGVNDYAPRLVQLLLGLSNGLLMFWLGRRLFGRQAGFLAGLFMATYWVFPYFEGVLTYPVLAVFLLLILFCALILWREQPGVLLAASAGAVLGGFALLRPNGLLFLPVLLLWLLWVGRRRTLAWPRLFVQLGMFCAACALVLAPAFIRNYAVARDVVFISSYGGINLYVGNHPEASLVEPHIPELMDLAGIEHWSCFDYPAIVRGLAAREGRESMRFSEANRYFYHRAFAFIREQPGLFLANMVRKVLLFWGPHEITNDTVMEYDKQFSVVLRYLPGFAWAAALFVLGLVLFVFDMGRAASRPSAAAREMTVLLLLFAAAYCLSVVIYFVAGRYRVPVIPILLLYGAYGAASLTRRFVTGRVAAGVAGITVFVGLAFLFHWNITGYTPSRGTWHLRQALAWTAAGDDARAYDEYLKALEHGASSSVVYANLGRLHIEREETEEGIAMYEAGLEQNPNNPMIRNNLGYELYRLGYLDAALTHLEHAVEVNPRFLLARINLGNALVDADRLDEALEQFEAARTLAPHDAAVYYNMARVQFLKGDLEGSASQYEEALALAPDFADALNNLGYIHAVSGRLDAAIAYYRRAIAADPDYLLAYNNLGNVLLDAGQVEDAAAVYRDALQRDPENAFAHYNLGRVHLVRGEWDAARACFESAAALAPDFTAATEALAYVNQRLESVL